MLANNSPFQKNYRVASLFLKFFYLFTSLCGFRNKLYGQGNNKNKYKCDYKHCNKQPDIRLPLNILLRASRVPLLLLVVCHCCVNVGFVVDNVASWFFLAGKLSFCLHRKVSERPSECLHHVASCCCCCWGEGCHASWKNCCYWKKSWF